VFGSLTLGPDNQIHGLVNLTRGSSPIPGIPPQNPSRSGAILLDPRTMTLIAEAGEGARHGFNNDGRQFLCRQHRHLMTQPSTAACRPKPYYTMPDPTVDIAVDGPKAACIASARRSLGGCCARSGGWRDSRTDRGRRTPIRLLHGGVRSDLTGATPGRGIRGDVCGRLRGERRTAKRSCIKTDRSRRVPPTSKSRILASKDTSGFPVHIANAGWHLYIADITDRRSRRRCNSRGTLAPRPYAGAHGSDLSCGARGVKQPPTRLTCSLEELVATLNIPTGGIETRR
jgi:hypothetical protein